MKRFFLVFCCIATLFLTSCSNAAAPEVKSDFEAVVTVEGIETDLEDFLLEAEISVEDSTCVEITVISPEEINGLSYIWNDSFELVYKNLHCKTEVDYLPRFTFAQAIYNVLCNLYTAEDASKGEGGDWIFKGKSQSGEYEVITDEEGYIQNISLREINLNIDFEYSD